MASGNLAAAAAFFAAMGERAEHARHAGAERGAKLVEAKAKAALGTYDFGWPELAEATQENRVRLGFSANEPELMSGKLRDSSRGRWRSSFTDSPSRSTARPGGSTPRNSSAQRWNIASPSPALPRPQPGHRRHGRLRGQGLHQRPRPPRREPL